MPSRRASRGSEFQHLMLGENRFRGIVLGGFQFPSSVGFQTGTSLPSLALAPPLGQSSSLWLCSRPLLPGSSPCPLRPDTRPGVPALCRVPVSLADEEGRKRTACLTSYIPLPAEQAQG